MRDLRGPAQWKGLKTASTTDHHKTQSSLLSNSKNLAWILPHKSGKIQRDFYSEIGLYPRRICLGKQKPSALNCMNLFLHSKACLGKSHQIFFLLSLQSDANLFFFLLILKCGKLFLFRYEILKIVVLKKKIYPSVHIWVVDCHSAHLYLYQFSNISFSDQ